MTRTFLKVSSFPRRSRRRDRFGERSGECRSKPPRDGLEPGIGSPRVTACPVRENPRTRRRHHIDSVDELVAGIACEAFTGDKASDAKALREGLAEERIEAVVPRRQGAAVACDDDRERYEWRHLVENFFCQIKAFRRIATRYEKTEKCFAATIYLVGAVPWTR